jgi:hypothetical protein
LDFSSFFFFWPYEALNQNLKIPWIDLFKSFAERRISQEMDEKKLSLEDVKRALEDPSVKGSSASNLIQNISNILGIQDLEAVDQSETDRVRHIYFQAIRLEADDWTDMPGTGPQKGITTYVQLAPFKLKWIPDGTSLVADVLIDKTDFEAECFDKYIQGMAVRGKNIIFYATAAIPVDIVIGLKCVDANGNAVFVPDECYRKKNTKG